MGQSKYPEFEAKCKKAVEHFKKELSHMRTGRASASLFEGIKVDYYGTPTPLQQLGFVNTPEPRLVTIQVYDPSAVEAVEKAILQSDLGLNPSRDGNLVRINIPHLTEERRKDLIKKVHKMAEECKVAVRSIRHEIIDQLKKAVKDKQLPEDESKRGQDEIQKVTEQINKDVDQVVVQKEKEMLEV